MRRLQRCAPFLERESHELIAARAEVARAAGLLGFGILRDPLRVEILHSVTKHATSNCDA